MKGILPAAIAALGLALLGGCEKEPERPVTPPPPMSKPAPAPVPAELPVAATVAQPLPESPPEVAPPAPPVAKKPSAPRKPPVPREPPVPAGFVRISGGEVTGADGVSHRIGAYAIARDPVTVGQLRQWAESEAGRRLPQLGTADAGVATDLDWLAADAYARWLGEKEKRSYRLPSEMEWVRAARSGRIVTQAQRQPAEPPLWEWTSDCWDGSDSNGRCLSRVLVGGEHAADGDWGRAAMGARRPAASFRLVLDLK